MRRARQQALSQEAQEAQEASKTANAAAQRSSQPGLTVSVSAALRAPLDSPTLGAATALATASLASPSDQQGGAILPARFMPLPQPSRLGPSVPPPLPDALLPEDRRGSLSPSKRRRASEEDIEGTSTNSAQLGGDKATALPPTAVGDAHDPPKDGGSTSAAADAAGTAGEEEEDNEPMSPSKRQARSGSFGLGGKASLAPPKVTVVDIFSPGTPPPSPPSTHPNRCRRRRRCRAPR